MCTAIGGWHYPASEHNVANFSERMDACAISVVFSISVFVLAYWV
jgi:hypothetical protein